MKITCNNCAWEFDAETVPDVCPVCQLGEKDNGDNCPNCGFTVGTESVDESETESAIDPDIAE